DGSDPPVGEYRLYKSRFAGLVAIVSASKFDSLKYPIFVSKVLLSIVSAMSGPWFGPIANNGKPWYSILSNCSHPGYSYSRLPSDLGRSKLVRPRRHSSLYPLCSFHP